MLESALLQGAFKMCLAVIGLLMARLGLLWMDRHFTHNKLTEWLNNEKTADVAIGIYYGCRIIAVAIVIGLAIS